MKIWFAANVRNNSNGGVARSIHELSSGIRKMGNEIDIKYSNNAFSENYMIFSISLCADLIMHILNPPDWIIARSTDAFFSSIFCRIFNISTKIILYSHGWEEHVYLFESKLPRRHISSPTTWKGILIRFWILRMTLRLCSYCISGTIYETRWLKKKFPRYSQKLKYLPNGTQIKSPQYWDKHDNIPINFLSVGPLTWKKNTDHTIRIFMQIRQRFDSARLFLVGTGLPRDTVLKIQNLDDLSIEVVPSEDPNNMANWYKRCPYLISSSRYEGGHSLAVLEAMSYGVVVFATDIFSTREIIRHNYNGFLISGYDVQKDASTIISKISIERDLYNIRKLAYHTAQRNSWNRQCARIDKLLNKQ